MKGFIAIFKDPDEIEVRFRAEGAGRTVGDALRVVKPGETLMGKTYEDLLTHGPGEIDF